MRAVTGPTGDRTALPGLDPDDDHRAPGVREPHGLRGWLRRPFRPDGADWHLTAGGSGGEPVTVTGPVRGWKWVALASDGTLRSPLMPSGPWVGEGMFATLGAVCLFGHRSPPPHAGCLCGFHISRDLRTITRWARTIGLRLTGRADSTVVGPWVPAVVAGWGPTVEHDLGWRTRWARLETVVVPDEDGIDHLEHRLGTGTGLIGWLAGAITGHSGPDPCVRVITDRVGRACGRHGVPVTVSGHPDTVDAWGAAVRLWHRHRHHRLLVASWGEETLRGGEGPAGRARGLLPVSRCRGPSPPMTATGHAARPEPDLEPDLEHEPDDPDSDPVDPEDLRVLVAAVDRGRLVLPGPLVVLATAAGSPDDRWPHRRGRDLLGWVFDGAVDPLDPEVLDLLAAPGGPGDRVLREWRWWGLAWCRAEPGGFSVPAGTAPVWTDLTAITGRLLVDRTCRPGRDPWHVNCPLIHRWATPEVVEHLSVCPWARDHPRGRLVRGLWALCQEDTGGGDEPRAVAPVPILAALAGPGLLPAHVSGTSHADRILEGAGDQARRFQAGPGPVGRVLGALETLAGYRRGPFGPVAEPAAWRTGDRLAPTAEIAAGWMETLAHPGGWTIVVNSAATWCRYWDPDAGDGGVNHP